MFSILGWQKLAQSLPNTYCLCFCAVVFLFTIGCLRGSVLQHDTLAKEIQKKVIFGFLPQKTSIYPAAVGLSAILSGFSTHRFTSSPESDVVVFQGNGFVTIHITVQKGSLRWSRLGDHYFFHKRYPSQ